VEWRAASSPGLDFAVWTLLHDGLRIPPFDRHFPASDDAAAGGVTPDGWRAWVVDLAEWAEGHPNVQPHAEDIITPALDPGARDRFSALWAEYAEEAVDWHRLMAPWLGEWSVPEVMREFWSRATQRGIDRCGHVDVHLVRYPGPAAMRVTQRSVLVATGGWMTSFEQFADFLFAALAQTPTRGGSPD